MENRVKKPPRLQRAGRGRKKTNTTHHFLIVNNRTKVSYFLLSTKYRIYTC